MVLGGRSLGRGLTRKSRSSLVVTLILTGPKSKEIKVETSRIDYLIIRAPKVEKLSLQPLRIGTLA